MVTYIRFEKVCKSFKKEDVLVDVDLALEKGKIYGFVGRNGSGKTVIFRMLTGLIRPSSGSIFLEGKNISRVNKFPERMGVLIENPGFIPHYSGIKNLKILNSMSKEKVSIGKVRQAMEQVGLDPGSSKSVKNYSLGMRQKLGIAQAIMNEPELLILDEPMNGLDEESIKRMRSFFLKLKEEKQVTILLASHNKEDLEVLCDELFELHDKKVRKRGEVKA